MATLEETQFLERRYIREEKYFLKLGQWPMAIVREKDHMSSQERRKGTSITSILKEFMFRQAKHDRTIECVFIKRPQGNDYKQSKLANAMCTKSFRHINGETEGP
ncbi:hypothetical protein BD560DRAFT_428403 [Blakeslea trispora]|nr:hypothetical protein BD560DRAFT_428403 [Blakeslea trispora]